MPNLLVDNLYKEVIASKAIKIYVCNVMTQKGETNKFRASDHLRVIVEHTAPGIADYCIVNTARIPESMLSKYKSEDSYPVIADSDNLKKMDLLVAKFMP
jgi:uncharacterized cofD-like protein